MRLSKEFQFHAAHRDVEATDQCGRLHGHTYRVEVWVDGHCGSRPMLIHGNRLKDIYSANLEPSLEHQYLNDTLPFNPTMENVARWMTTELAKGLHALEDNKHLFRCGVRLWETPTMSVSTEMTLG